MSFGGSIDEVRIAIDGQRVPAAIVGTNDGLNYGRFFQHEPVAYEAVLPIACLGWYAPEFAALVDEMREDDKLDEQPSALAQMGYCRTLAEAAEHPDHPDLLAEVVRVFCDRELLAHHFPFDEASSQFVINSTDAISVVARSIVIRGRCWRHHSSSKG
jgi:hypothetical protein